jgi:hypothetical protein
MASHPPIIVSAGILQQQPVGDILAIRGDLDVGAYKIYSSSGSLIIEPHSSYALQADSTGDLRGTGAIDLQRSRTSSDQVASGYYAVICGGLNNEAAGYYSVVCGGDGNVADATNAFVGGGISNSAGTTSSVIGGGDNNSTSGGSYATVAGGYYNAAQAEGATVGGGASNYAQAQYTTVAGGNGNYATYNYATAGGGAGNVASANYATCSGGSSCTANGVSATCSGGASNYASAEYATVGGGYSNDASSDSTTIGGGYDNTVAGSYATVGGGSTNSITANGSYGTICGGYNNEVKADYSAVIGGSSNDTNGDYSTAAGYYAETRLEGEAAQASGAFSSVGDAQTSVLTARIQTTNSASQTVIYLDGSSKSLVMPESSAWLFNIHILGHRSDNTESSAWLLRGLIRRAGSNNPVIVGTRQKTIIAEDDVTWDADVRVDTTNDALEIYVTGHATKTIKWVARIELVQIKS